MNRPDYLAKGSVARLFPVLATTSKEGRTTSIVLASMMLIEEFGRRMLATVGRRLGQRATLVAYTEIVFKDQKGATADQPDGLLIVTSGKTQWRALIETKVGKNELTIVQIEKYRQLATAHGIDAVITISNQFAASPQHHPLGAELDKRLRIPVFHWSWMFVLTTAELLASHQEISDKNQAALLNELRRFLSHDSSGIEGFSRMPREWSDVVRLVSAAGSILKTSDSASAVVGAWFQETRDLSLLLTRKLDVPVSERMSRKHHSSPEDRKKDALAMLAQNMRLQAEFVVPDAASDLTVCADLKARSISVSMTVRAPEDRKSSKARLNWLLRQLDGQETSDIHVRFKWPGRSAATQKSLEQLLADPGLIDLDREHLQVSSFDVFCLVKLGGGFAQQSKFISELETMIPRFYETIGQNLSNWRPKAPKVKSDTVTVQQIAAEAEDESIG